MRKGLSSWDRPGGFLVDLIHIEQRKLGAEKAVSWLREREVKSSMKGAHVFVIQ